MGEGMGKEPDNEEEAVSATTYKGGYGYVQIDRNDRFTVHNSRANGYLSISNFIKWIIITVLHNTGDIYCMTMHISYSPSFPPFLCDFFSCLTAVFEINRIFVFASQLRRPIS